VEIEMLTKAAKTENVDVRNYVHYLDNLLLEL